MNGYKIDPHTITHTDIVRVLTRQVAALAALAAVTGTMGVMSAVGRIPATVVVLLAAALAAVEGIAAGAIHRRITAPARAGYRRMLARAIRRDIDLERRQVRGRPPIARLLAEHADIADRIARRLEKARVDPRAVVEVRLLLEDGRPSSDRLRRVAFLVERDAA